MDKMITLWLNGSQSLYLDNVAWTSTQTLTWLPFLLALLYVVFREHDMRHFLFLIGIVGISILIADQVASSIFKPLVERWRPSQNPYISHTVDVVKGYRGGLYGFFSSHAANTFAIATFFALLFRHRATTLSLMAWALLNVWTRLYLGVHYVGDVLAGMVFGLCLGVLAHRCYSRIFHQERQRIYYGRLLDIVPAAFCFTLTLIAIPWRLLF